METCYVAEPTQIRYLAQKIQWYESMSPTEMKKRGGLQYSHGRNMDDCASDYSKKERNQIWHKILG
jgi:hypothetical protein